MPLAARLNTQVIDDINNAIASSRRFDRGRDTEIGGILLGAIDRGADGTRPIVYVERFQPVISEYRRGSSYVLSDHDKKVLARKLEWWNKHGRKEGLQPVGFFRSHTRRGLYLDNDDFVLLQEYFRDPASLFLLVRPGSGTAGVGGFFFWGKTDIHREASYQEFPFDSNQLPVTVGSAPAPEVTAVARPIGVPLRDRMARPIALVRTALSRKQPVWLQIAAPLVVGVVLGVAVFALTTHVTGPQTASRTAKNAALSKIPAARESAAKGGVLEKPSPLEPRSRPVMTEPTESPAPTAIVTPAAKPPVARPFTLPERGRTSKLIASPMGSASRVNPTPEHEPVPAAVLAPPPVVKSAHPAESPLAMITVPARVEHLRRPPPVATVTVEPVSGSRIGKLVGRIPGLRRRRQDFVPARPIKQVAPSVPADEHLERSVPVDLRITIDPAGNVAGVEQTSRGADSQLVRLASDAARSWQFVPARKNDETVTSELILHFTFPGSGSVDQ
jgi:hypothetical protein